jgi:choline dehydrogenase-like flavoprotein
VLPYLKKAENWQGEASKPHGSGGFLTTAPMSERPAACQAIIAAVTTGNAEVREWAAAGTCDRRYCAVPMAVATVERKIQAVSCAGTLLASYPAK